MKEAAQRQFDQFLKEVSSGFPLISLSWLWLSNVSLYVVFPIRMNQRIAPLVFLAHIVNYLSPLFLHWYVVVYSPVVRMTDTRDQTVKTNNP